MFGLVDLSICICICLSVPMALASAKKSSSPKPMEPTTVAELKAYMVGSKFPDRCVRKKTPKVFPIQAWGSAVWDVTNDESGVKAQELLISLRTPELGTPDFRLTEKQVFPQTQPWEYRLLKSQENGLLKVVHQSFTKGDLSQPDGKILLTTQFTLELATKHVIEFQDDLLDCKDSGNRGWLPIEDMTQ